MAFEDVAKRMKGQQGWSRLDVMHEVWHGEPRGLAPPIEPFEVTPQTRRSTVVTGYVLLVLGLLVTVFGSLGLLLVVDVDRGGIKMILGVAALGIVMIVKGAMRLSAASEIEPLPGAKLR